MKRILLTMLAATLAAAPAAARDKHPPFVVAKPVKDAPTVALDPSKAYLLLRSDAPSSLYLMRVPSAEDQAAYALQRAEALADARKKYQRKRADYDRAVAGAAKLPKGTPAPRLPEAPIEPTESNFEFTPFGMMAAFGIGPMNRFAKGKGGMSTYLHEITPGEYRIYGPLTIANGAAPMGMCYCMGSVKFAARAGEITDMGVILSDGVAPTKATEGDSSMPLLADIPNYLGPAPADMTLDPRLATARVQRAAYRPVGKLPNYFGVTIGRISAMPGVLRYDRDRIVDLTAAQ